MTVTVTYLKWALYVVTLFGLFGAVFPSFKPIYRQSRLLVKKTTQQAKHSFFYRHLDQLLYLARGTKSVNRYLYIAGGLFVGTFTVTFLISADMPIRGNIFVRENLSIGTAQTQFLFAALSAVIAVVMQYVILRILAFFRQRKAGYDLLIVVKTLPQFSELSIEQALLLTADQIGRGNLLQKPLRMLSYVLSSYNKTSELEQETQRFISAVGTTFAVAFISDIVYAHQTGTPWHESMFALGDAMELRLSFILDAQKNMSDAIHTGLWGNAVSLIGICGGLVWLLGWPVYASLQFRTASNMLLFMVTLISILAAMIVSLYLIKPALDYK